MMLLCGQSNRVWHFLAGRHPGSVGVLVGPSYYDKVPIDDWMPFALDNDAFGCWMRGTELDVVAWQLMLRKVDSIRRTPLWAAVPDVVGNKDATIELWRRHAWNIIDRGWDAAFVAQDGMRPCDVPKEASVVFVGGTDGWKFHNLTMWTEHFGRVHCARVNAIDKLEMAERVGCESADGTGWFRDLARFPRIRSFAEGFRTWKNQPELTLAAGEQEWSKA